MSESTAVPAPQDLAAQLEEAMHLFWESFSELNDDEVEQAEVMPSWTPKALVAHVAFWDDYQLRRMQAALDGSSRQGFTRPAEDNDERAALDATHTLADVIAAARANRALMVEFARSLSQEVLTQTYDEAGTPFSIRNQLEHMAWHVRSHRREIQLYCGSLARWRKAGLRDLLEKQYVNLMDSVAGLSEETMLATQVCGKWSIRDVLAHVLSWNEYCTVLVTHWPAPADRLIEEWAWQPSDTMASMNDRLMAARRDLTIIEIADGLVTQHRRMLRALDGADDTMLESEGLTWGGPSTLSCQFYEVAVHEAEHAAQIWAFRAGVQEQETTSDPISDS